MKLYTGIFVTIFLIVLVLTELSHGQRGKGRGRKRGQGLVRGRGLGRGRGDDRLREDDRDRGQHGGFGRTRGQGRGRGLGRIRGRGRGRGLGKNRGQRNDPGLGYLRDQGSVPGLGYDKGQAGNQGQSQVSSFGLRSKRALPRRLSAMGFLAVPRGQMFSWKRDFGTTNSVNENAFVSSRGNVVLMLSFDPRLEDFNMTETATLYDFNGPAPVVVLKPKRRPNPCYLMDTSVTYEEILSELDIRNGSSVATSTVITLDGTGEPLTPEEKRLVLEKTPSLRRHCRGRQIVKTMPIGFAPITYEGETKDIKVFTLDAEISLTVRAERQPQPFSPFGAFRQWLQGRGWGQGRGQDQGQSQSRGQSQGRGRKQGRGQSRS